MKIINRFNNINESSRRQKAVSAINGKKSNIRSICILTSENPRFDCFSDGNNKTNTERRENLEKDLKLGHYAWFPVKGKYGDKERSYIIYNIPKDDAMYLAKKFGQEAFIYIENNICEYYEQFENHNKFTKTHERKLSDKIDMSNASDYFTQISKAFKFQIPFFDGSDEHRSFMKESINYLNEILNSYENINEEIEQRLDNTMFSKSGQYRFYNRSFLYKNNFIWD